LSLKLISGTGGRVAPDASGWSILPCRIAYFFDNEKSKKKKRKKNIVVVALLKKPTMAKLP
jgi:hypothetical protein